MSRNRHRNHMPPGLKAQIFFAAVITLSALLVLPSTLSAEQTANDGQSAKLITASSAGSVATTTQEFRTAEFAAGAFADWD